MASRYWVGGGSANTWAAITPTNWSATDGGAGDASVPGTTDDVFFTANSPTGTGSVVAANITIQSLDCTGYTHDITINASRTLTISGSGVVFKLVNTMTLTLGSATSSALSFTGTSGTTLITTAGLTVGNITFNGTGGGWQLQDDLISSGTLTHTKTTLDFNNNNVTVAILSSSNSNVRTLTLGSGQITITGTGTCYTTGTSTNLTLNKASLPIKFTDTSVTAITVDAGGVNPGTIWFSRGSGTGNNQLTNGDVFDNIIDTGTGTHRLRFPTLGTVTTSDFHVSGTSGHLITIDDGGNGIQILKISPGKLISCDYLSIKNNQAGGTGATFYAGANSTDGGGNVGWIFTAPPVPVAKNCVIIQQAIKRAAFI